MSTFTYDGIDPVVLYEMFVESATRLGGTYISFSYQTEDPSELDMWLRADRAVMNERLAISPDDREAQIAAIERWNSELNRVTAARALGASRSLAGVEVDLDMARINLGDCDGQRHFGSSGGELGEWQGQISEDPPSNHSIRKMRRPISSRQ
ncbi:MAG: hypothetical protein LBM23_07165 [Propionibacteriaceae bacterium]|nr:hypothetical protein [Propionibacteriaceae bacterium]